MSLLSFIIFAVAFGALAQKMEGPKTYSVKKIPGPITLSGKGDHHMWQGAAEVSDFAYPWENSVPPPGKFKAVHDERWLYCFFQVEDPDVNILRKTGEKDEVASSSRAEIFFRRDEKLDPYYCLEIDPTGRVLDYEARHYRKFNPKWSWPQGQLIIKTTRKKDGYTIELAISKKSLRQLGLLTNGILQVGLFRAECFPIEGNEPDFKWISWIRPASETPDFHIPSSFGIFKLEE